MREKKDVLLANGIICPSAVYKVYALYGTSFQFCIYKFSPSSHRLRIKPGGPPVRLCLSGVCRTNETFYCNLTICGLVLHHMRPVPFFYLFIYLPMPLRKTESAPDINILSRYVAYFSEMLADSSTEADSTSATALRPSYCMSQSWMATYREPNISVTREVPVGALSHFDMMYMMQLNAPLSPCCRVCIKLRQKQHAHK